MLSLLHTTALVRFTALLFPAMELICIAATDKIPIVSTDIAMRTSIKLNPFFSPKNFMITNQDCDTIQLLSKKYFYVQLLSSTLHLMA